MDKLDLQMQIQNVLPQGVNIEGCKDSAYLKTYTFSQEKDGGVIYATILFHYNSKEKITSIRPKENSELAEMLIGCFCNITWLEYTPNTEYEFPKSSLRDFFEIIQKEVVKYDIAINGYPYDFGRDSYRQRYTFTQGKSVAVFDFVYNKNGDITNAIEIPKDTNSVELANKVRDILNSILGDDNGQ